MPKSDYSKYLPSTLQEAYVQAQGDPGIMNLHGEMALLRTLLGKYIEENSEIDADMINSVTKLVDKIARTQGAISVHEQKSRQMIHVSMIPILIRSIVGVIRGVIQDEKVVARIAQKIQNLPIALEAPKEVSVETKNA